MPLRDHFRPPVSKRTSWEGFHGMWPGAITARLNAALPEGFVAEPRVHLGAYYEIDVAGFVDRPAPDDQPAGGERGGSATAAAVAPVPTLTLENDLARPYEYEVLVYDENRGREIVAAVELVSPGNKDRPEARHLFAGKCATLLRQGVCVAVVDVVTSRSANLYAATLDELRIADPSVESDPPAIYAASLRRRATRPGLDAWAYPLAVGSPLPSLPLWLAEELWVPLDLESSYEDACRALRIP